MTTATAAKTFKPPWAVTAWLDDTAVYIEIPATNGPPYIQRYSLTEGGLSSALKAMKDLYVREIRCRPTFPIYKSYDRVGKPKQPSVRAKSNRFTPEQRATALEVLKRMKLVP